MALENLSPVVREERLLAGEDLEPANRLEYFLKQAGSGGSGSVEYEPVLAETTKSVNDHGWTTSFSGGPIFEGTSYRVTVNGVTYEPLVGTAGELSYICLGNTYVDDADPTGDYPFGIFYKNGELTAWLETGESITMQIDQIIQLVPVPTPAATDTGKVLTANNGSAEWSPIASGYFEVINESVPSFNTLDNMVKSGLIPYFYREYEEDGNLYNRIYRLQMLSYDNVYIAVFGEIESSGTNLAFFISSDRTSRMIVD